MKKLDFILKIASVSAYLAVGVVVLILTILSEEYSKLFIGLIVLACGLSELICYFGAKKYLMHFCLDHIFASVCIAMGLLFVIMMGNNLPIDTYCLIWGIFEIARGVYECIESIIELRHKKMGALVELSTGVTFIVFGVLLTIHLYHGLTVHFYVTAIVFLVLSVVFCLRFFVLKNKNEAE